VNNWLNATFAALGYRHFRILWTGTTLAFVAFFMSTIVQGVVAFQLTGKNASVGLVALGMLPGRVLMSVFGSVGLLVNVPWAISWFFPGEGRAPLLILVAGVLILLVAVLLTRMGGRFREELVGLEERRPPTRPHVAHLLHHGHFGERYRHRDVA